jgi:hypothetical protein
MPDARACRKRQIQITPRPFGGAGASRALLTNGRYPVSRVWAHVSGLCGPLVTRRWLSNQHGVRDARPDLAGSFPCLFASRAASKSREIDSMSPAGDSIPRKSRFRIAARKRRLSPHSIMRPIPRNIGFHHLSPAFCPGWASVGGETPVAACARMR